MTPEAFRVLRERDRGLADLFHVLPLGELPDSDNLRVLVGLQRQLESRHRCRFTLEALPAAIDLQRRYARDAAFPGKAAGFLKRLALKADGEFARRTDAPARPDGPLGASGQPQAVTIDRDRVIEAFGEQSGLPPSFLDQHQTLDAALIRAKLAERFVGQTHAVQAAVEIIGIAKARLNDPGRPIASLLLLGPTGVGKTEFAKSLAAYLFGHADRLLRFDMNEYVSPSAVPQLIGTLAQPEGLLTAAVRRQPFAVLLFDEIEKGHPDVFDLLLQVLGEGRLTDALGRTTDFSNALVILTSNLGTRPSEVGLGFNATGTADAQLALQAARNFFRPEFFNRLDRVLPFAQLAREDLQRIARHLMADVLQRDGLVRRRCVLHVAAPALDWVLEQGYQPALGARALKRAIERELARPIARYLAAAGARRDEGAESATAAGLTLIEVGHTIGADRPQDAELSVFVRQLQPRAVAPGTVGSVAGHAPDALLARCAAVRERLARTLPALRPQERLGAGPPSPRQTRYFTLQQELTRLGRGLDELRQSVQTQRQGSVFPSGFTKTHRSPPGWIRRRGPSPAALAADEGAEDAIQEYLAVRSAQPARASDVPAETQQLLRELAWLDALAAAEEPRLEEQLDVSVRSLDPLAAGLALRLAQRLQETWSRAGLDAGLGPAGDDGQAIRLRGPLARLFAVSEAGYHAVQHAADKTPLLVSVQVDSEPIPDRVARTVLVSDRHPDDPFPGVDPLLACARDTLPLPGEFA
jgi:hypothetical protein